jgi:bZIP factor
MLNSDALRELGVPTIGQRLAILKAIYQLKIANNIPLDEDHYIPPCELGITVQPALIEPCVF